MSNWMRVWKHFDSCCTAIAVGGIDDDVAPMPEPDMFKAEWAKAAE